MNYQKLQERVAQFMRGAPARVPPPNAPPRPHRLTVPAEYLSLHKYLDGRYANTVVLTFGQIEDLLGFSLPDLAHQPEWWSNPAADSVPSAQSRSWTEASRTATPNLGAQNVVFERA